MTRLSTYPRTRQRTYPKARQGKYHWKSILGQIQEILHIKDEAQGQDRTGLGEQYQDLKTPGPGTGLWKPRKRTVTGLWKPRTGPGTGLWKPRTDL